MSAPTDDPAIALVTKVAHELDVVAGLALLRGPQCRAARAVMLDAADKLRAALTPSETAGPPTDAEIDRQLEEDGRRLLAEDPNAEATLAEAAQWLDEDEDPTLTDDPPDGSQTNACLTDVEIAAYEANTLIRERIEHGVECTYCIGRLSRATPQDGVVEGLLEHTRVLARILIEPIPSPVSPSPAVGPSQQQDQQQNRLAETENVQPQKPGLKGESSMTDAGESTPSVLCAACGCPHIASLDGDDYGSLDGECSEFVPPISLGQAWVSRVTDANAPDSPSIIGAPEPTRREFYERLRHECDALRADAPLGEATTIADALAHALRQASDSGDSGRALEDLAALAERLPELLRSVHRAKGSIAGDSVLAVDRSRSSPNDSAVAPAVAVASPGDANGE